MDEWSITPEEFDRMRSDRAEIGRFVEKNIRLVHKVARKVWARWGGDDRHMGLEYEDLVQEGRIAMLTAIERFDHSRGFRFSTYAVHWIRQKMTRAIRSQGNVLCRLPDHIQAGAAREDQKVMAAAVSSPVFLDQPLLDGDLDYHDIIPDRSDSGEAKEQAAALAAEYGRVRDVMEEVLDRREIRILDDRLLRGRTLLHIGGRLGLSRERVRQIQNRALSRVRDALGVAEREDGSSQGEDGDMAVDIASAIRAEIERLEGMRSEIDRKVRALEEAVEVLNGSAPPAASVASAVPTATAAGKRSDEKAIEGVLRAVAPKGMRVPKIAESLEEAGIHADHGMILGALEESDLFEHTGRGYWRIRE